jgi:hypothetical protein
MTAWDRTSSIDAGSVSLMVSYDTDSCGLVTVRQVLLNGEWCAVDEILCRELIDEAAKQITNELAADAEITSTLALEASQERADQVAGWRA